jgi:FixJ family two-component response regulator
MSRIDRSRKVGGVRNDLPATVDPRGGGAPSHIPLSLNGQASAAGPHSPATGAMRGIDLRTAVSMPAGTDEERRRAIVFVVDDDGSVRDALGSLLRSVGWQVKTFETAAEFLQEPWPETPACLVLDVRLPGTSGLELQRSLSERGNLRPVIFMTGHGDIAMSVQAMKAGAVEFLPKPFKPESLIAAVAHALQRDAGEQRERAELAESRRRLATLSPREREVMLLTVAGLLNKQIAARLNIAENTVKVHRRRVMEKMAARSLPELVRMVEREQTAARAGPG